MNSQVELVRGLPRKLLLQRIFHHMRNGEVAKRALGFYLLDMEERREYQALGYSSTVHFAEVKLGLSPKETRELIRISRRLEELVEIDRAFTQGEISWSKVRELTRVAVRDTEEEWLEFAKGKLSREVELAVSNSKRGERPPRKGGLGTPRTTFRIKFDLPAHIHQLVQTAISKLMTEQGEGATPGEALREMAEWAISRKGKAKGENPIYTVVVHTTKDRGVSWIDGEDGPVPIPREVLEEVMTGNRVFEVEEISDPGDTDAACFGRRGTVPEEERDGPVPKNMRTAVLARDGNRCYACGSRRDLRVHHIKPLCDGGTTEMSYLVTLCLKCHSLVHEGFLKLKFDREGRLSAYDGEDNPLNEETNLAAVLGEGSLTVLEKLPAAQPAPSDTPTQPTRFTPRSIEEIPSELEASEWRTLAASLTWDSRRKLFVFDPGKNDPVFTPKALGESGENGPKDAPRGASFCRNPLSNNNSIIKKAHFQNDPQRPLGFDEFVGQKRLLANLRVAVRAARERGEALGHVLLSGPSGLGKTTLARITAHEMGGKIHWASGPVMDSPHKLIQLLIQLRDGDFLFIDEIHRLPKSSQEALYTALEDRSVTS